MEARGEAKLREGSRKAEKDQVSGEERGSERERSEGMRTREVNSLCAVVKVRKGA